MMYYQIFRFILRTEMAKAGAWLERFAAPEGGLILIFRSGEDWQAGSAARGVWQRLEMS